MNKIFFFFIVGALTWAGKFQAQAQIQKPKPKQPESAAKSEPTALVSGRIGVVLRCIAEGGDVYWLVDPEDRALLHIKREGGGDETLLVRTNTKIEDFIADATGVYYLSQNKYEWGEDEKVFSVQGELRRINKKDGGVKTLLPNVELNVGTTFVAADATDIYFFALSKGESGVIIRVPKNGGEPQRVASQILAALSSFVVDERNLYWLDVLDKSVIKATKIGGEQKVLFRKDDSSYEPIKMIGDEKYLYVMTRKNDIYQIRKEDGTTKLLYPGIAFQFFGPSIAVDGDYLYWREDNKVMRMSKADEKPMMLSLRNSPLSCMTVDDKYVYWFERDKGLMRLEK